MKEITCITNRYFISLVILLNIIARSFQSCKNTEVKSEIPKVTKEYHLDDWWGPRWQETKTYPTLYSITYCKNITLIPLEEIDAPFQDKDDYPHHLKINQSNIREVPVGVFMKFSTVSVVKLDNNNIQSVQPGAFNGLSKLEELYLNNNTIKVIARGVLNSLANLKILDVSYNLIQEIEENSFLGLMKLETLLLKSNHLKHITPTIFTSQKNLKYLDLSANDIKTLPMKVFFNLTKLDTVLLNSTNLQAFESFSKAVKNVYLNDNNISFVANIENVEKLDLTNNSINFMTNLGEKIKYARIGKNNITQLNFSFPIVCKEIDLGYNAIKRIEKNSFAGLTKLKSLNLTHNLIGFISVGSFKDLNSLELLDLSSNNISEINFGLFFGLGSLTALNLKENRLRQLPAVVFHELVHLEGLDVSNNKLSSFAVNDIVEHLNNLKFVDINNNSFTCETLVKVLKRTEKAGIEVVKGESYEDSHVHGIPCKTFIFSEKPNDRSINLNNSTSLASLGKYDLANSLVTFFKYLTGKRHNLNNTVINVVIKKNSKTDNFEENGNSQKSMSGNMYVLFCIFMIFITLLLFVIMSVLLYVMYIMLYKREKNVYRVKYIKNKFFDSGKEMDEM